MTAAEPRAEHAGGFGALLRRYRAVAGLTQEVLAERSGLSVRAISDLERGAKLRPHRDTLRMLGDGLNLTAAERTALAAAAAPRHVAALDDLPLPSTPLIDREAETAAVAASLREGGIRLLTLTGPGGVGKTRLALRAASDLRSVFADGVGFVPLGGLVDPSLVPAAIARVVGVREMPGKSLVDVVQSHLRTRHLLLVLDNFEHLLAAAEVVANLLAVCPRLSVLVTSRSPLRLRGEHEFPVAPLELPSLDRLPSLPELEQVPAVALFVQQARAVQPAFALDHRGAVDVATICRRVDGLPLAIELAAARIKVLTPPALRALLTDRLPVLTEGPRDAPARQRTLRDAIAWSYDLLSPGEQTLFRRLAICAGCALEAAAAVGDAGDLLATLRGLTVLVDHSLIRQEEDPDGESRYTMLETIREFGLERLEHADEADATRDRHAARYLALGEGAEAELAGPRQLVWLERLDVEIDNLRLALGWSLAREEPEPALRAASALWRFWVRRGRLTEGRDWLERGLACSGLVAPEVRAKALHYLGTILIDLEDYQLAEAHLESSLVLRRAIGEATAIASTVVNLGVVALNRGDYRLARNLADESLKIRRELQDHTGASYSLILRGDVAVAEGDFALAWQLYQESLIAHQERGDVGRAALVRCLLGTVCGLRGEYAIARRYLEESLEVLRRNNDTLGTASALRGLGRIATLEGDPAASAHYLDALALHAQLGNRHMIVECLEGVAVVAANEGEAVDATQLLGAASTWRGTLGTPAPPSDRPRLDRAVEQARGLLDGDAFRTAWETGLQLSLEQAMVVASRAKAAVAGR